MSLHFTDLTYLNVGFIFGNVCFRNTLMEYMTLRTCDFLHDLLENFISKLAVHLWFFY